MGNGGIRMNDEKTYPVTYDTFKNRILEYFLEKDWDYNTHFTKEQKQEFIDKHNFDFKESYEEECENYDKGLLNVFTTPEDTHKYVLGLLFDCEMYFNSKENNESQKSTIDESKYPMTYQEFENVLKESFIERAQDTYRDVTLDDAKEGWETFLKEEGPFHRIYNDYCEMYDYPSKRDVPKEEVFSKPIIGRQTYSMVQWVFF